jgi:TonB family protein
MVAADWPSSVIVRAKIIGHTEKTDDQRYSSMDIEVREALKRLEYQVNGPRASSMDIEVHEVLRGTIAASRIRIASGGIEGGSLSVREFPINTEWILVLQEGSSGFTIPACGPRKLRVKDGIVIGNITDLHNSDQEMPLLEFTTKLKEIVTPSMPKAFISTSESAKPDIRGIGIIGPLLLESPTPPYPEEAKRRKIEGDVIVHAIVRKDGSVDKIRIIGALDNNLDQSVIDTIGSRWRFASGTVLGKPADIRTIIRCSFRLDSPLRVVILEDRWEFGGRKESTVGYGNLIENGSIRGFEYIIPELCEFGKKEEYPAVWKKPGSNLEIRVYDNITTGIPALYKLQVTMKDFMYQIKDGALITLPIGTAERTN